MKPWFLMLPLLSAGMLLPEADAWQDEALSAAAAKVQAVEALPAGRWVNRGERMPIRTLGDMGPDSPLLAGAEWWRREVPELLRRTAETGDATLSTPHGFTALQAACLAGDAALIRALVEAGASVNGRPHDHEALGVVGELPLSMLAADAALPEAELLSLARLLLEHGADPDAEALYATSTGVVSRNQQKTSWHKKYSPLLFGGNRHWIPLRAHNKLDLLLLEFGEQDYSKRFLPAGDIFIPWWCLSSSVIRRLLKGGADPRVHRRKDASGLTSEKAKRPMLLHLVRTGDVENVELALQCGAELPPEVLYYIRVGKLSPFDAPEELPYTPERAVRLAQILIAHGADVNWSGDRDFITTAYSLKQPTPARDALLSYFYSLLHVPREAEADTPQKATP